MKIKDSSSAYGIIICALFYIAGLTYLYIKISIDNSSLIDWCDDDIRIFKLCTIAHIICFLISLFIGFYGGRIINYILKHFCKYF